MKRRTLLILLWTFVLIFWNGYVWQEILSPHTDVLTVAFLNIGQGDAVFIEAPNGVQMLIDGGKDKTVLSELAAVMPKLDNTIDVILATHSDADHIGGLDDVLGKYKVSLIVDNGRVDKDTVTLKNLQEEIQNEVTFSKAQYILAKNGTRIILDQKRGVYFDIYFPATSTISSDSNDVSIVGKLIYGQTEFMLTGDAGTEVENKLLGWCSICLVSDVLKVGHHGSKTSTGKSFLDAVNPSYAIISAGKDNTYGHPHKEVVNRLKEKEIKIIETAEMGTIVFESNGTEVKPR